MKRPEQEREPSSVIAAAVSLTFFLFVVWTVYDLGGLLTFGGMLIIVMMSFVSLLMYISIKYGKGEDENILHDLISGDDGESVDEAAIRERVENDRKQGEGSVPAEQLAFARSVASAAGCITGGGKISNALRNAARKELSALAGGNLVLVNELLVLVRKGDEDWYQECSFRNDEERIREFFSAVARIITAGGTITWAMKERFTGIAAYFGLPADEAMDLIADSTGFRKLWEACDTAGESGNSRKARGSAPDGAVMSCDEALRILGVSSLASDREIKKAYLRLAGQCHPDKARNRGFNEETIMTYQRKFETVTEVWNTIRRMRGI